MKLRIKNINSEYTIHLNSFTQLCGLNFIKKDFIVDSITKYFTNSKYQEYEEKMIDNIFLETGEQLGRDYFKVIRIDNRIDLIDYIKLSKGSILKDYIDNELQQYNYQLYIENIRDLLEKIYIDINKNVLQKIGNIRLSFKNEELLNIIHKSEIDNIDDKLIEENTNIDLLNIIIELVKGIQKQNPCRILFIVKDIDHLVSKNEYDIVYNKIKDLVIKTNTYFLSTISINNYAILDKENLDGVNVVNDVIFQIEDFDKFKGFILNNYPMYIDIPDVELLKMTNMVLQHIGSSNVYNDLRANIILKMIDNSLAVNFESHTELNDIEISFLNS